MQTDEDPQTPLGTDQDETIDEATMDDLFREILAAPPSPTSTPPSLTFDEEEALGRDPLSADVNTNAYADEVQRAVQKLLDLVPGIVDGTPRFPNEEGDVTALELDLGAWEASIGHPQPVF